MHLGEHPVVVDVEVEAHAGAVFDLLEGDDVGLGDRIGARQDRLRVLEGELDLHAVLGWRLDPEDPHAGPFAETVMDRHEVDDAVCLGAGDIRHLLQAGDRIGGEVDGDRGLARAVAIQVDILRYGARAERPEHHQDDCKPACQATAGNVVYHPCSITHRRLACKCFLGPSFSHGGAVRLSRAAASVAGEARLRLTGRRSPGRPVRAGAAGRAAAPRIPPSRPPCGRRAARPARRRR